MACALTLGCGDDGGSGSENDTDPIDSGFSGSQDGTESDPSTADPTSETTPTDPTETVGETEVDTETQGGSAGYDTLGEGPLRGLLSFTLYAADAATGEDILGMAGAWRNEGDELDGVEDFFGVYGLDVQFPAPPSDEDTLEHNAIPAAFEWGGPTQWVLAGTAMKLRLPDAEALACLLYFGGTAEVEFPPSSGTLVPNYPLYAATPSNNQPEGCAPDPSTWQEDTEYDIVLYGGDAFDTNSLVGQVHTPPSFELTAPDIDTFQLQVPADEDLELSWSGEGNDGNRMVVRVFDMFGRMFTVHAADDGSFTIPADDLSMLTAGPATLTVARENLEMVPFTDGTVQVLTRYEQWAYIDLY